MINGLNFSLRQLRYFLAVAEELHFGRAARQLNVSQPPVSVTLRQLEKQLGVRLFERNAKSVRLTPAGAGFATRVATILEQLRQAQNLAQLTDQGLIGKIRVGFVPSMIFRDFLKCIDDFRAKNPQVELELLELNSARQIAQLESSAIDIGFIHGSPILPHGLEAIKLQEERFVCCVPQQHRLAKRRRIFLKELAGEAVIMFKRDYAAHYHDRIVGLLRAAKVEPHLSHEISHWFTVLALVAEGMGLSIVPESLIRLGAANIAFVEVADKNAHHTIECIWQRKGSSPAQEALLTAVSNFYGVDKMQESAIC